MSNMSKWQSYWWLSIVSLGTSRLPNLPPQFGVPFDFPYRPPKRLPPPPGAGPGFVVSAMKPKLRLWLPLAFLCMRLRVGLVEVDRLGSVGASSKGPG